MSKTGWIVEDRCPQCGGPVAMRETDHIIQCEYCRVRLYVLAEGVPKYCLPVKPAPVGDIVMVPYWRIRGLRFRVCGSADVRSEIVDITSLAARAPRLPPNLGVRAQAVPLRFASARDEARFLPAAPRPEVAGKGRPATLPPGDGEAARFDRFFEAASALVYAPVRVARSVFDGVLNRRIPGIDGEAWMREAGGADDRPGAVRFLPTLCPECGWQLEGAPDTLVLTCVNCGGGWQAGRDALRSAAFRMLRAEGWTPHAFLPFWRLRARVPGIGLESWADLVRFANLPRVLQEAWEREPLHFWIPAFDLHPDRFLRVSRTLTLARPDTGDCYPAPGSVRPAAHVRPCHPVTLPGDRLDEAVRILLASLGHPRPETAALLSQAPVETGGAELAYVPVLFNGREYVNPGLQLTLSRRT